MSTLNERAAAYVRATPFTDRYPHLNLQVLRYRILRLHAPQFAGDLRLENDAHVRTSDMAGEVSIKALRWISRWTPEQGLASDEMLSEALRWASFWNPKQELIDEVTAHDIINEQHCVGTGARVHGYADQIEDVIHDILALNPPPAVAEWAARSAAEVEKILEGATEYGDDEYLRIAYLDLAHAVLAYLRAAADDDEREFVARAVATCTPRWAPRAPRDVARRSAPPRETLAALASRGAHALLSAVRAALGAFFARPAPARETERLAP